MIELDVQFLEFETARARDYALELLEAGFPGATGARIVDGAAGYAVQLGVGDVGLAARALRSSDAARVLARPRLRFRNGGEARFQSGEEVPIPVIRETAGDLADGIIRTFEYRDTGIILDAGGSVLADGALAIRVHVEVSAARIGLQPEAPRFTVREVTSDFVVADGETVLISGLRSIEEDQGRAGVARWLPLSSSGRENEAELLVLVTARALDPFAVPVGGARGMRTK